MCSRGSQIMARWNSPFLAMWCILQHYSRSQCQSSQILNPCPEVHCRNTHLHQIPSQFHFLLHRPSLRLPLPGFQSLGSFALVLTKIPTLSNPETPSWSRLEYNCTTSSTLSSLTFTLSLLSSKASASPLQDSKSTLRTQSGKCFSRIWVSPQEDDYDSPYCKTLIHHDNPSFGDVPICSRSAKLSGPDEPTPSPSPLTSPFYLK